MNSYTDRVVASFDSKATDRQSDGSPSMSFLVDQIAKSLVDHPEQVKVQTLEGDYTTIIELRVAKEDLGKVIGKQGRTAHAMRTVISAVASKVKKRTVLEIVE